MKLILALAVAASCVFRPGFSCAEDATSQLTGTWKPVSWLTRFDGGNTVEPFGPNPKGRLVLTPDSHWIIILNGFFIMAAAPASTRHTIIAMSEAARQSTKLFWAAIVVALLVNLHATRSTADPQTWRQEWPVTDFTKHTVALTDIRSGGPSKDGIPAIDSPRFEQLNAGGTGGWARNIVENEPVISLVIGGDARAYPVRILIWHEIVNDTVGGIPVVVTYCPLCNSGLVFKRSLDDRLFDFGTTGNLRNSDLVMYDWQTESWWQQFTGEAIVGALSGRSLRLVPSRMESLARFRQRFAGGKILVPTNPEARNYGQNPYVGYDAAGRRPFLYDGSLPEGIDPMERVVAVETAPGRHEAWALTLLRRERKIESGDLIITWEPGQSSALDSRSIVDGRDVGGVVVQKRIAGAVVDAPYDVTFAFALHAFRNGSPIHGAARTGQTESK